MEADFNLGIGKKPIFDMSWGCYNKHGIYDYCKGAS